MSSDQDARLALQWRTAGQKIGERLSRSLSKDNLALVPTVTKLSNTLSDVRKNVDLQVTSVAQKLSSLEAPEDWAMLGRAGAAPGGRMRRSVSDNNFMKPVRSRLGTIRAPQLLQPQQQPPGSPKLDGWDWLGTINNTLGQARKPALPRFQLPESVEQQAKQLVNSASALNLEDVASTLRLRQQRAVATAAQTLGHASANLASLQAAITASLSESRSSLEQRLATVQAAQAVPAGCTRRREVDLFSPFLVLPGYLRGREIAAIERVLEDDSAGSSGEEERGGAGVLATRGGGTVAGGDASTSSTPWGPFQQQAAARRRAATRAGGGSSLRDPGRHVTIVTTAALPWMTGTAVNPLLRAAHLARDSARSVTLMIPWLATADQSRVFPHGMTFDTPDQQERYVRDWVKQRTGFESDFQVTFYPGRYAPEKCSILPVGDPTQYIPDSEADVAILEEPEHLNWYHHGRRWTDKFTHVVGVVHTNYLDYARREHGGAVKEALLRKVNDWVCRVYCHKVVKLSNAVQPLPRQTTRFVHGVADSFLEVGERKAAPAATPGGKRFTRGAYFIGKVVWAKGYTELLGLVGQATLGADASSSAAGSGKASPSAAAEPAGGLSIDCYGAGEDLDAVKEAAGRAGLPLHFHGAKDHLDESMHEYQVFINPSTSDVVATTSAEALAMGKWVVCADHPSNAFFSGFSNCLVYKTPEEFSRHVAHALSTEPAPLPPAEREALTWQAATERFLDATELTEAELNPGPLAQALDGAAWLAHNTLTGIEPLRAAAGAGTNTRDNPPSVADYQPAVSDVGGLFDDRRRVLRTQATRT